MTISANFPTINPSLNLDFANTAVLDPRITFTRSVPAVYYDNHTTTLAEQNFLTYSNTFTNPTWALSGVDTPVLNVTDPAGTANGAYTLTASLGSSVHILRSTNFNFLATPSFVFSCFLKAGTSNFATLNIWSTSQNATWVSATFNLATGALTQQQAGNASYAIIGTPTITQVGSTSWYRCVVVFSTSGGNSFFYTTVQMNSSATPTLGANGQETWASFGAETILVYGAQLEQRGVVTAYTPTTTSQVVNYIPTLQTAAINAPRFDYDPVTRQARGLLVEKQSTNLATQSQTFSTWDRTTATVTNNVNIAPDGTNTASILVPATSTIVHFTSLSASYGSGTFTFSVYAKAAGYPRLGIRVYDGTAYRIRVTFNIATGTVAFLEGGTATITPVGNGWYRCTGTGTSASGNMGALAGWVIESLPNGVSMQTIFTGDGYSGAYIWGAQIEAGASFPTSYIATTTAATVRTADLAVMTGTNFSSWFNAGQGTFFTDSHCDILESNIARLAYNTPVQTTYALTGVAGYIATISAIPVSNATVSVNQFLYTGGGTEIGASILNRIPFSANLDKVANYINNPSQLYGVSAVGISGVSTTNSGRPGGNSYPTATTLTIGYNNGYYSNFSGHVKKLAFYPAQVSATQLEALTGN